MANTGSSSAPEGTVTSGGSAREYWILRNVNSISDLENESPQVKKASF